jgi:protein TonB
MGTGVGGAVASGHGVGVGTGAGSGAPGGVSAGGGLGGRKLYAPEPTYPEIAKAARAEGTVSVKVMVDEDGNVVAAEAVSGHPLLRGAAVDAARAAKFKPTVVDGKPVKVSGLISYDFTLK